MVKRVVKESVVVARTRDGKTTGDASNPLLHFTPPIDKPFDFTADELKQIEKMRPEAVSDQMTVDLEKSDAVAEVEPAKTLEAPKKSDAPVTSVVPGAKPVVNVKSKTEEI